jgi:hypothetical protein
MRFEALSWLGGQKDLMLEKLRILREDSTMVELIEEFPQRLDVVKGAIEEAATTRRETDRVEMAKAQVDSDKVDSFKRQLKRAGKITD